mmetsp:Transcript_7092/g.29283  ORF Transcript_7092/g.29283 Transcript_7092/m.29283 type:complete len:325 (+) Transcript_7092:446-1420(+)
MHRGDGTRRRARGGWFTEQQKQLRAEESRALRDPRREQSPRARRVLPRRRGGSSRRPTPRRAARGGDAHLEAVRRGKRDVLRDGLWRRCSGKRVPKSGFQKRLARVDGARRIERRRVLRGVDSVPSTSTGSGQDPPRVASRRVLRGARRGRAARPVLAGEAPASAARAGRGRRRGVGFNVGLFGERRVKCKRREKRRRRGFVRGGSVRGGRRVRGRLKSARGERVGKVPGGQGQQRAVRRAERAGEGGGRRGSRRASGAAAPADHRGVRQGRRRHHPQKRAELGVLAREREQRPDARSRTSGLSRSGRSGVQSRRRETRRESVL